jgi:hypothetical protein
MAPPPRDKPQQSPPNSVRANITSPEQPKQELDAKVKVQVATPYLAVPSLCPPARMEKINKAYHEQIPANEMPQAYLDAGSRRGGVKA